MPTTKLDRLRDAATLAVRQVIRTQNHRDRQRAVRAVNRYERAFNFQRRYDRNLF